MVNTMINAIVNLSNIPFSSTTAKIAVKKEKKKGERSTW